MQQHDPRDQAAGPVRNLARVRRIPQHLAVKLKSPGFVCMALGGTIICLLLMQPVWNSILMLHNPVLLHFLGKSPPAIIITACVCLVVLYLLSVFLFFRYNKKASQSEQNVLLIANVFTMMLGALVLIISMPIRRTGMSLQSEILEKCQHGVQTHGLYMTYVSLLALRRTPGCASKESVEMCQGFSETPNTDLLKDMEFKYKCSGWCTPPTLEAHQPVGGSISFLQLDEQQSGLQDRPNNAAARAWFFKKLPQLNSGGAAQAPTQGPVYVYPPTLFSLRNFEATCDGMAARASSFFLTDTADGLYYEGLYLMVISIGIGFLKLLSFCMKDNIFTRNKKGRPGHPEYGGTDQRYISQGVLS